MVFRRRVPPKRDLNFIRNQTLSKQEKENSNRLTKSSQNNSEKEGSVSMPDCWAPSALVAIKALVSARLCAAIWSLINDCDETYNYWEPTHFLLYGKGFQTWEYSPTYALRSYTYLMLHVAPAYLYSLIQPNRMLVFFFIRCFLAMLSSFSELYFYRGVIKSFGANTGRIMLGISLTSSAMFISSTAYLPSSFSMYMTMLSYGAWFHGALELSIFTTALSAFVGWPFAALLGLPIAVDIVLLRRKWVLFLKWSSISTFTILMPLIQYDSSFFGKFVAAPFNIVLYNVLSGNGPNLYGTAPLSFYIYNGFLNFNFAFIVAIFALPLYGFFILTKLIKPNNRSTTPIWLPLSALFIWFSVFFTQPHKEERFLFPAYPIICLSAAFGVDILQEILPKFRSKKKRTQNDASKSKTSFFSYFSYKFLPIYFLAVTSTLSISRIIGQYQGYHAPFGAFMELKRLHETQENVTKQELNLCYGKEWHRFPSHFFVPSLDWKVNFIESEFKGQLPQHFGNATSTVPDNMNDNNAEEPSRYVPVSQCHILIDLEKEHESKLEPNYSKDTKNWKVLHRISFLDAQRSPKLLRAFYIPFVTENFCYYDSYIILLSKHVLSSAT